MLAAHARLSLRRGDAWFVRAAHRATLRGDLPALAGAAREELASRAARLQRTSSLVLGRNMLRVAGTISTDDERARLGPVERALGELTPRASVFGSVAAVFAIGEDDAVEGHVYSVLAGTVAAAVRLALVGTLDAQAMLRRLVTADDGDPDADWCLFSPLLDIASMHHERLDGRTFAS